MPGVFYTARRDTVEASNRMARSMIFFLVARSVSAAGARVDRTPAGTMESAQDTRAFSAFISAALAAMEPEELRDYVALHELVHFLHHDHQAGFYAVMDGLMPDWRRRRAELKSYAAAL